MLDEPPFEAYQVDVRPDLHVRRPEDLHRLRGRAHRRLRRSAGLYAAGELVGGLFYHNYPGGTGLTSGAVFGKIAGEGAAGFALGKGSAGGEPTP